MAFVGENKFILVANVVLVSTFSHSLLNCYDVLFSSYLLFGHEVSKVPDHLSRNDALVSGRVECFERFYHDV